MFSHLSEVRFPEDSRKSPNDVGPGSYDVPSSRLDRSALIMEGCERFQDSSLQNSLSLETSFSIFVDEVSMISEKSAKRMPLTPRGVRQCPFGRSTKENVSADNATKTPKGNGRPRSLGAQARGDDEDVVKVKCSDGVKTPSKKAAASALKLQSKEKSIAELQKMVEDLEREGRDAKKIISGLGAQKAEYQKALQTQREELSAGGSNGAGDEVLGLREQLKKVVAEKEHLRDHLLEAAENGRTLEIVAQQAEEPQAISALVSELVGLELATARRVLCLQRKAWDRQAEQLQQHTEKLERKVEQLREQSQSREEQPDALARVAEAEAKALQREAELLRLREEVSASRAEADSFGQLNAMLQERLVEQQQQVQTLTTDLEASRLEERRLKETAAVWQDSCDRYMEREATMAGHANHKQKICIMMDLKKDNVQLRTEVQRLQQQLNKAAAVAGSQALQATSTRTKA